MNKKRNQSKLTIVLGTLAVLISAYQIYSASGAFSSVFFGWDLLSYIGTALHFSGLAEDQLHNLTYGAVETHAPKKLFHSLVAGSPDAAWKEALYRDPALFKQTIPYFAVKPFYPALILLLHRLGVGLVEATLTLSITGYLATSAILLLWLRSIMSAVLAAVLTSIIVTHPTILPAAVSPTPDTWYASCALLALFLVAGDRIRWGMALAVAGIAIRPDSIILVGLLAVFSLLRRDWITAAAGITAGGAALLTISYIAGAYPWATFFYHSIVTRIVEPATFVSPLTFVDYINIYERKVLFTLTDNPFLVGFIVLGLLVLWARVRRAGWADTYTLILILSVTYMVIHWLVVPFGLTRYLLAFFIAILVALIKNLADAFGTMRALN